MVFEYINVLHFSDCNKIHDFEPETTSFNILKQDFTCHKNTTISGVLPKVFNEC